MKGLWFFMNNVGKINKNSAIYSIFKGFVISIVLSLVLIFIYAIILVNTNIQENTIKPVIITITSISILIGSSISSIKIKSKGLVNGICVSLLYFVTFYLLSSIIVCGFSFSLSTIIMMSIGILIGAVGGIIGVNLRR